MVRLAMRIAIAAGTVVLTLVIADRALGLVAGPVIRPVNHLGLERTTNPVGTQLRPGFEGVYATSEYRTAVRINTLGLRGPEIAEKAEGRPRILAFGDSFTFGQGVDYEETWPAVLEQELATIEEPVEVVNAGWVAVSPSGYLTYLTERGWQLDPDLVLVAVFVGNDAVDEVLEDLPGLTEAEKIAYAAEHMAGLRERFGAIGRSRTGDGLGSIRGMVEVLAPNLYDLAVVAMVKLQYAVGSHRSLFDYVLTTPEPEDVRAGWSKAFASIEAIVRQAEGRGRQAGVIVVPFYDQVATTALAPDLVRDQPQQRVMAFCAERALKCLDLLPELRASGTPADLYYLRDGHWTARGQAVAARAIGSWLVHEDLWPPAP